MRAAVIRGAGGPEVLEVEARPVPSPGLGEVLVRVHSSALNRADILQRMGRYPAPPGAPSDIAGIEFAGVVEAIGSGAQRWRPGDRVYGICGGGAHAEYVVAHEGSMARIPQGLDDILAGAVPEAFITAHDAMVTQAGLATGETLLIHAVGSGVGLAASQLGAALGARVLGTSRSPEKLERAKSLGVHVALHADGSLEALREPVRTATGGRGVNVTLDLLGGPYLGASVEAAALKGRIVLVGTIAGATSSLDLRLMLGKRLTLKGTVLRARDHTEKAMAVAAFVDTVQPLLVSGAAVPVVDSVYSLADIRAAHSRMESNDSFGKIVIDCR